MTDVPRILGGRYEVGDLIGRGGMAQVHIGYDSRLSRTVAIKVLRSDLASDPTFLARFRREAQSAASLNHPAIVAVYDTGEETVISPATGRTVSLPYIVMEYVKGRTVSKLLTTGQALPINEAVQIVVGVLSALEYSHYEGIVHRDIKPGNVMLTQDGKVKVMDFGIARAVADSSATMTSTNSVVGTAQYLSPEQARGEVVDTRSDLYSAGCLLYELLTGKPPFQGDSAVAVAYQHVSEIPKPPSTIAPDISDALDRVVMKSLAKKREDRYQTAEQMRSELLAAVRGGAVSAPAIGAWQPTVTRPAAGATQVMGVAGTGAGATTGTQPSMPTQAYSPIEGFTTTTDITPVAEKKGNGGKIAAIVAVVVLALLGIAGIGWWAIQSGGLMREPEPPAVTQVEVPDLTGMTLADARRTLEQAGLTIEVGDPVEDDTVPQGQFVSSDPAVGTMVDPGTKVTVHFSDGVGKTTMPDVTGGNVTQEEARKMIEEAGLVVGNVETVDEPGVAENIVVDTDPAPNKADLEKGTTVTLYVSSGEVPVPNVVGLSLADAQNALGAIQLSFDTSREYSDSPADTVISQTPGEGKHPYDTRIQLVISDGPEPQAPTPPATPPADNGGQTGDQPATDPNAGTGGNGGQNGGNNG